VRLRLGPGHVRRALPRAPPHRGRPAARVPGSLEGPVGHHLAPDAPKSPRTPLRQPQSRARHPRNLARQEHRHPPRLTAATGNAWESRPPTTVPIPPTSGPGHTSLAPFSSGLAPAACGRLGRTGAWPARWSRRTHSTPIVTPPSSWSPASRPASSRPSSDTPPPPGPAPPAGTARPRHTKRAHTPTAPPPPSPGHCAAWREPDLLGRTPLEVRPSQVDRRYPVQAAQCRCLLGQLPGRRHVRDRLAPLTPPRFGDQETNQGLAGAGRQLDR